ncbi:hypothetical protein CJI97_005429 [Candidozyma auris]|uniref:hypothetical_protein n=1 Tax=Candidozyma auris TaxID=498019 RepID=UPI000C3E9F3F|nr:hypothetical_protein [[Candida] auris]PIS49257.1 hypothetical protein CJI97_005429 [[Candida] auris]QEO23236.1 hypothetical_protein [[Candida] auris]GBL49282.1 hypothetical protein CAJCM15448_15560 [[Candida] auris]
MTSGLLLCIKQFNARLGDELNLAVGDKIEVLADDSEYNDGWYMGKSVNSGKVGLFPKSFTKPVAEQPSEPTLLRSRSRRVPSGPKAGEKAAATTTTSSNKDSSNVGSRLASSEAPQPSNDVNMTMSEIDKALEELQVPTSTSTRETTKDNIKEQEPVQPVKEETSSSRGHNRNVSTSSLTTDLNPLQAAEWTPKQVSSYFAIVLGFDMSVAGKFARHKITGEILFQLDLAHLKELDIDSFGTRFEVYKEIEKLKEMANRAQGTKSSSGSRKPSEQKTAPVAAPAPTRDFESEERNPTPYNNSDDESVDKPSSKQAHYEREPRSASTLLPAPTFNPYSQNGGKTRAASAKTPHGHSRTRSQSMENLSALNTPKTDSSFMSPRKAPEPPGTMSPINKNFKFGGSSAVPQSNDSSANNFYMTRTNASSGMINSPGGPSRPASSIYDASAAQGHHRTTSSNKNDLAHRRHSSLFSFMSGNGNDEEPVKKDKLQSQNLTKGLASPTKSKRASRLFEKSSTTPDSTDIPDIDDVNFSPKKGKDGTPKDEKRNGRLKSLRSVSTSNFRGLTGSRKSKTSAFQEGIRDITPDEAIKTSNFSGWMSKKSGSTLGWRSRYFTLHGTRLSYFTNLRDKREKGLIDITAHKVIPISTDGDSSSSNDKYIALYAASTGLGRFCFKLVPPAPGFKKGLTFTQPKTHYFAVETQEEMKGWLKALMTATIDIDDSVPVVSSCNTPTVSLAKAQELLAKAREENKLRDEELRAKGFIRDGEVLEDMTNSTTLYNDSATSEEASPVVGYMDETTISSSNISTGPPKLTVDTSSTKNKRGPTTPQLSSSQGFSSPYLLASGILSPKHGGSSAGSTPNTTKSGRKDYFPEMKTPDANKSESSLEPQPVFSNSNGRVLSGSKKKDKSEKLMAYTSDGSFVIKSKK